MLSGGSRTLCGAFIRLIRWPVWVLVRRSCVRDMNHADTPCGVGTPYEKLVTQEFSVLMFGVTLNTYTLFRACRRCRTCALPL